MELLLQPFYGVKHVERNTAFQRKILCRIHIYAPEFGLIGGEYPYGKSHHFWQFTTRIRGTYNEREGHLPVSQDYEKRKF